MKAINCYIFILVVFWCLNLINIKAQNPKKCSPELTADWSTIKIINSPVTRKNNILIITNRPYLPGNKKNEIFPNDIANYRKVSYLFSSCTGKNWDLSFIESFDKAMSLIDNGNDILLFVHGHGKTFPQALERAKRIKERYNVSLIMFDWPSKNSNLNLSMARVRRCGENFYNTLLLLKKYREENMKEGQHLSMMLHSLGNYFLTHMVVNGNNQYVDEVFLDNILMSAPAIRSKEHGEVLSQLKIQKRLVVSVNKNDFVLRGAHILTSGKMLGNIVIEPLAPNAKYVHFENIAGREHTFFAGYHDFEFKYESMFYFFNTVLHGYELNFENEQYFLPRSSENEFDITLK